MNTELFIVKILTIYNPINIEEQICLYDNEDDAYKCFEAFKGHLIEEHNVNSDAYNILENGDTLYKAVSKTSDICHYVDMGNYYME